MIHLGFLIQSAARFRLFLDPESSFKTKLTKHSGQAKGTSSQQLLHTNILFELQVWLASTQSIDLELQLGSRAPVGWSFNVVQGVWQTTDASPQITIPRGESLVRLWASSPGLRMRLENGGKNGGNTSLTALDVWVLGVPKPSVGPIRSLTMQFQNVPDECGFVPGADGELWTCSRCAPGLE